MGTTIVVVDDSRTVRPQVAASRVQAGRKVIGSSGRASCAFWS